MVIKEKIKAIWQDKRELDFYARWTIRLLLFVGVAYLVFFKDTETVTIFKETTHTDSVLTIYDRTIIEKQNEKEQIRQKQHEVYYEIDSVPRDVDSIAKYITRATREATK